ncbi:MAG: GMC family oxidoreductase [Magnetospirillum sp.]|nr:GMC family oxidoreductase [Magnetospirillum sp.]
MILDARQLPDDIRLEADVAIVGAGPAGITLALELEQCGVQVLLLESGGPRRQPRDTFVGDSLDPRHPMLTLYRSRGLGGTSDCWGGRCVPLDPIDFAARPWIRWSGWPISYAEASRFTARALAWCEAGRPEFSARGSLGAQAAPAVPGLVGDTIDDDSLERFSPPTHFGRRYRPRLARSPTVTVLLSATCTGLALAPGGGALDALTMASAPGRRFTVAASAVVLAAGGLETARLLLASRVGGALVGRFYMCHLEGKAAVMHLPAGRKAVFAYEQDADGVYLRRTFTVPPAAQERLGIGNAVLRFEPPTIADPAHGSAVLSALWLSRTFLKPEYARKLATFGYRGHGGGSRHRVLPAHLGNVLRGTPHLAAFAATWARRHWLAARKLPYVAESAADGSLSLDYNVEQVPNPDSRVTLGEDCDAFGLPRLVVDWRSSPQDLDTADAIHRLFAAAVADSGAGRLEVDEAALAAGFNAIGGHHIGTARMAADPSQGVVDRNCQVFGIANLFVAGAAVFPTSGHANPTLSIVALACRLADFLRVRLGFPGS